ncbi:MAG TPA: hypothetical protein DIW81_08045 [Planctomycetaceae bacterium]|nr:hypothetical protein [Rubinisphaera sp.]HCS51532.1 hypothetical protein [Planctomycetaceae bacterium]
MCVINATNAAAQPNTRFQQPPATLTPSPDHPRAPSVAKNRFLNLRSQIHQVHDLRHAGSANVPQSCEFGVVGDMAISDQLLWEGPSAMVVLTPIYANYNFLVQRLLWPDESAICVFNHHLALGICRGHINPNHSP